MSVKISPKQLGLTCLLVVLGAVFYAWYQTLEWEEEQYDLPARPIAIKNDYLAASRLLEDYQYTVTQPSYGIVLNALPEHDAGIMWLSELDSDMLENHVDALFDWIKAGGHLISAASFELYDPTYETSSALNKKLREHHIVAWTTGDNGFETYYNEDEDTEKVRFKTYTVQLPDGPTIKVSLPSNSYLNSTHPQATTIDNEAQSSLLVTQPLGLGRITLLNSPRTFVNANAIENVDNAYLLLWLANLSNADSISIIENTRSVPGLMATLWAKAPLVITSLLMVLLGWLIIVSRRLGPVEIEYDHGRSNLLAHLAAKAQFWKRHGQLDTLLQPLRVAAIEKIRPQANLGAVIESDKALSNEELDYAATLANCSRTEIQTALMQDKLSSTDFSNSVSVLRNLLKHRTSGPSRL